MSPSIINAGFVPLLMFCNASPMFRNHEVLIKSDAAFVAIMVAFSVSAGYTGNLVYIHAPKRLKADPAKEACALLCNFAIVSGIATGSMLSYGITLIL